MLLALIQLFLSLVKALSSSVIRLHKDLLLHSIVSMSVASSLLLKELLVNAAKTQLFEQNDESQRNLFINIVEPYLRDVQGRRGVTDFLVKCDDDNNPAEAVDRGEFYAEIYVKPTRTINYITLSFVATRTGVAFEEVAS
jgi:hypothetical protein